MPQSLRKKVRILGIAELQIRGGIEGNSVIIFLIPKQNHML